MIESASNHINFDNELKFGGEMTTEYLVLNSQITEKTSAALTVYLVDLSRKGVDHLHIAINSPGGNVSAGITIYNLLKSMPFDVTTYNLANVDSIAGIIFLAGNKRIAANHSRFLFHGVGIEWKANQRMDIKRAEDLVQSLKADNDRIARIIVDNTSISEADCLSLFSRDSTRAADWCLDRGFVHEIGDFSLPKGSVVKQHTEI